VISVAANVVPKHISQICSLNLSDQFDDAKELDSILYNLYELLFIESNPIPVKWMLYKMGLIKQSIRLPLIELDETFHDEVMSELNKHKLI
jgi:4-hydroxy-tetrahydrodipicolinate synthase